MMKYLLRYLMLACLVMLPFLAMAEDMPGVDWRSGMISANGIGVPPEGVRHPGKARAMACRAAMVVAQRNLLETTKGVRVDSVTLVKDAMVESDLIRTSVEGIVKGARMSKRRLMSDGSCEVTATMPMAGDLFSALISEEKFHQQTGEAKRSSLDFSERMARVFRRLSDAGLISEAQAGVAPSVTLDNEEQVKLARKLKQVFEAEGDRLAASLLQRAITDYQQVRDFTGIVIDASAVPGFHPAALPWIRDNTGVKLYPNADTPYEVVRSNMPVSYDFNVDDAVKNKRVATKPLVLKAVSTYKSRASDLMLDQKGEKDFMQLMRKGFVNENARIMIVVSD